MDKVRNIASNRVHLRVSNDGHYPEPHLWCTKRPADLIWSYAKVPDDTEVTCKRCAEYERKRSRT